jgi:hypothetical protein
MQPRSNREPPFRADGHSWPDIALRLLVTAVVGVAAVLLILASLDMNYTFWARQAADVATARVLGAVSIAIDLFKATLPLIIGWAGHDRRQIRLIGTVFFGGCLVFSFISAIGFAVSSRGTVNDARETVSPVPAGLGTQAPCG